VLQDIVFLDGPYRSPFQPKIPPRGEANADLERVIPGDEKRFGFKVREMMVGTSPWYDPGALDRYFALFTQGARYEIDDDEFSLPDETDEVEVIPEGERPAKKRMGSAKRSSGSTGPLPTASERSSPLALADLSTKVQTATTLVRKSTDTTVSEARIPPAVAIMTPAGKYIPGFSTQGKLVTCSDAPASGVHVRQKNYKKTGQKAASEPSLYEFVALDVLRAKQKISKVYAHMHIPWVSKSQPPDPSGLPEVLIVNLQIPNKGPQMFRSSNDTDPGTSVVYYFKLRHPVTMDPATKLAASFFAGTTPGRFKAMSFIDNINELKFPSFLTGTMNKFNGKPVIIFKTGAFFREGHVYEVDVDVFQFPVLARTALSSTRGNHANARTRAAFVLQGDTDDELPERLLGCCEVRNLDLDASAFDEFAS